MAGIAVGGSLLGAAGGAIVGAVMPEVLKVLEERQRRSLESVDAVVSWTAELAGMTPVELYAWAVEDERRLALIAATIQAAMRSTHEAKLRALARVLSEAVEDDARLDTSAVMTEALAGLEPMHIRVLRAVSEEAAPIFPAVVQERQAWRQSAIAHRFPNLREAVVPIMATLERYALVHEGLAAEADDRAWGATPYGAACLAYLREVPVADAVSAAPNG